MCLEAGAHNLLRGVYVKVCRTLLQGCVRLRHDLLKWAIAVHGSYKSKFSIFYQPLFIYFILDW